MGEYLVVIMPSAAAELHAITDWYARQNPQIAHQWYAGFRDVIFDLAENPYQHGLSWEHQLFSFDIR